MIQYVAGNLHFANVMAADDRKGLHYVCIVQNMELRSLMQGDDQKIESISSGNSRHVLLYPI